MTLNDTTAVASIIGAVSATVAAVVAALTMILEVRKRRDERRRVDQDLWTMKLASYSGRLSAQIDYHPKAKPLRMLSLRVLKPRGTRLQLFDLSWDLTNPSVNGTYRAVVEPVGAAAKVLSCARDLGGRAIGSGTTNVLIYLPTPPLWARKSSTRVRIEVSVEESTASRRQSAIVVTSQEIPWTARSVTMPD